MVKKFDNSSEIVKKMGYSNYYVRKIKGIKNKQEKRKYLLNLFLNFEKYHLLRCDLKSTCLHTKQVGGSKTLKKINSLYKKLLENDSKDKLSNIALQKQLDNRNKEEARLKRQYDRNMKLLQDEVSRYKGDIDSLKQTIVQNNETIKSSEDKHGLTKTKIKELENLKVNITNINIELFQNVFADFYEIFSNVKDRFLLIKLIKTQLFSENRKDIREDLVYTIGAREKSKKKSEILNYTKYNERLDIFNERLVPMKQMQKNLDDSWLNLYYLQNKYGFDASDLDYELGMIDNIHPAALEVITLEIRYKNATKKSFQAMSDLVKFQKVVPKSVPIEIYDNILNELDVMNKLKEKLQEFDLDFLKLVIVNTLHIIECGCTSPCNYSWETTKAKQWHNTQSHFCLVESECNSDTHQDYRSRYTKECNTIDTSGGVPTEETYVKVFKRKGRNPKYYVGHQQAPYHAPMNKQFCFKKVMDKIIYPDVIKVDKKGLRKCTQKKQTIDEFFGERTIQNIEQVNKMKQAMDDAYKNSIKTEQKQNNIKIQQLMN
jgi:hypothetical protein